MKKYFQTKNQTPRINSQMSPRTKDQLRLKRIKGVSRLTSGSPRALSRPRILKVKFEHIRGFQGPRTDPPPPVCIYGRQSLTVTRCVVANHHVGQAFVGLGRIRQTAIPRVGNALTCFRPDSRHENTHYNNRRNGSL